MSFTEFTQFSESLQSPLVTKNISCLVIDIFSDKVVKLKFLLLPLDGNLFSVVTGNRYLPRGGQENVFSITITRNLTMSR